MASRHNSLIPLSLDEIHNYMAAPDAVLVVKTRAQEAGDEETFDAIMNEADWQELPPVFVSYDTIYARGVSSVISISDEEAPKETP